MPNVVERVSLETYTLGQVLPGETSLPGVGLPAFPPI